MKIYPNQLTRHLHNSLASFYVVAGDEPLLVQESRDAILQQAKKMGFESKEIIQIDKNFDWDEFLYASKAQSLFSTKTILECRFQSASIGKTGGEAMLEYLQSPPPDKLLLIICPKIESSTTKTKWYEALDRSGVIINAWPIERSQLTAWIKERMAQAGLSTDSEGLNSIADFTEGNLLASAQEIEKIKLIHNSGKVSAQDIEKILGDSSRFDIYQLVDTALSGNPQKAIRILEHLEEDGTEAVLILWAITREIRTLINIHYGLSENKSMDQLYKQYAVWTKKQSIVSTALKKLSLPLLVKLLKNAEKTDRMIKGLEAGNVFDSLTDMIMSLSLGKTI